MLTDNYCRRLVVLPISINLMSTKYTVKKQNNPLRFKQNLMIKTTNKQTKSILLSLTYKSRKDIQQKGPKC